MYSLKSAHTAWFTGPSCSCDDWDRQQLGVVHTSSRATVLGWMLSLQTILRGLTFTISKIFSWILDTCLQYALSIYLTMLRSNNENSRKWRQSSLHLESWTWRKANAAWSHLSDLLSLASWNNWVHWQNALSFCCLVYFEMGFSIFDVINNNAFAVTSNSIFVFSQYYFALFDSCCEVNAHINQQFSSWRV